MNTDGKIPLKVVHYSKTDPLKVSGGVETFARNLEMIFSEVEFACKRRDIRRIMRESLPVICDNYLVTHWPEEYPVIGFQHGVGAVKAAQSRKLHHRLLAWRQKKASLRKNTFWIACADWISKTFEKLHGNKSDAVIYHHVDVERFHGRRDNVDPRLILHDARFAHKGKHLVEILQRAFPDWKFEPLACQPHEVPDRMSRGRAFIHLSKYEGNSIVCNEAMAMNLPCLFTRVGLMKDENRPTDVYLVDANEVYRNENTLKNEVARFLESLDLHTYRPREWILNNATPSVSLRLWKEAIEGFDVLRERHIQIPT